MYSYSVTQWILLFFLYAFIGWIWECAYVSTIQAWKKKTWRFINRGFLHGPVIPIYGFAAIAILWATIGVRESRCAIFVLGALTATLFELVTGTAMEKLFKVKYWDYSNIPLNYKGHICFFVSLFWGFFSVLLVQGIHVPVERILLCMVPTVSEVIGSVLLVLFTYDLSVSVREAMDLREILDTLAENNEMIRHLERRFDAIVAFTPIPDIDELRSIHKNAKEHIVYKVERLHQMNEEHINKIKEYISLPEFEELPDRAELLRKLEHYRGRIREISHRQFVSALRQLRRNPDVKSEHYQNIIEQLNEWIRDKRKE